MLYAITDFSTKNLIYTHLFNCDKMKLLIHGLIILSLVLPCVFAQDVVMTNEQTNLYLDFNGNSHYNVMYSLQNTNNHAIKIPKGSLELDRKYDPDKNQKFKIVGAYDKYGSLKIESNKIDDQTINKIYAPSKNINLGANIIYSFNFEFDIQNQIENVSNIYILSTGPFEPAQKGDYNLNIILPETFFYSSKLIAITPLTNSLSNLGSDIKVISFSKEDLEKTNYAIHIKFKKILNRSTIYGILLVLLGGILSIITTIIFNIIKERKCRSQ